MRANSSLSSLVVVVLALVGGCSPAEESPVALPELPAPEPAAEEASVTLPELPAPEPAPAPSPVFTEDLSRQVEQTRADQLSPPVRRLFFQCTDDVSFAVHSVGNWLEVYPPGHSNGYIVLTQQPSDSGLHYTAGGAELRLNGDLATLHVDRDRYADCVSNPAAAVWEDPRRGGTPAR